MKYHWDELRQDPNKNKDIGRNSDTCQDPDKVIFNFQVIT